MLTLTDRAVSVLKTVFAEDSQGLRIGVATGGCAGVQYSMGLENEAGEDDEVLDLSGVRVFVAKPSTMFLAGVVVDFVEGEGGGGFTFTNPNAPAKCSCSSGGCG
jgi:iron-sulfur cluster assembly protein